MPNTTLQQKNGNLAVSGNVSNASEELNDISNKWPSVKELLKTEQEICKSLFCNLTTDDFLAFKKSGMNGDFGSCEFLDAMDLIARSKKCIVDLETRHLGQNIKKS